MPNDMRLSSIADQLGAATMSEVERTSAGLQIVIPGCERRTLPRSTTRVDNAGQGLLGFYKRMHHCGRAKDRRRCRKVDCSALELVVARPRIFQRFFRQAAARMFKQPLRVAD